MKKIFSLLVILLTIGCSKIDDVINSSTQIPVDVYVAGIKNNNATYWKNNQELVLAGGIGAEADTISVSNNNVYVLGKRQLNSLNTEYLFWKNNVLTNLSNTFSTPDQVVKIITGMKVVNDDVYFVGYTKNPFITAEVFDLVYWKNGIKTILNQGINIQSFQTRIIIHNNDVYVSAIDNNNSFGYYFNAVFTPTPDFSIVDFAKNNNDIYMFGSYLLANKILNITANSEIIIGFSNDANLIGLCFDKNNMYYSNGEKIFENSNLIYTVPLNSNYIFDFTVKNGNTYLIEGSSALNNSTKVLKINNVIAMTSANGENYKSLFID